MAPNIQAGLEWEVKLFGIEPRWTKEPNIGVITKIAQQHLKHDSETPIDVTFHAQGGFNKLYKVAAGGSQYLMRVTLPVDPQHKTESEVATIEWIRQETDAPVPGIIAYDSSNQNELGFEWILMELMPGGPLRQRWRQMSWEAKETLIRHLVAYQAQIFDKKFYGIGNIYFKEKDHQKNSGESAEDGNSFTLGRIVSMIFFWGDHLHQDAPRGPFKKSYEWLRTRLEFVITDQIQKIQTEEDEDEIEEAESIKEVAEQLIAFLSSSRKFPRHGPLAEPSILFHDDLSSQNILVDESGKLTAIIDWECVSAVPLWRACQLPHLLNGRQRDDKPDRTTYAAETDADAAKSDGLDNEGVSPLYWEHLLEYEQTQLGKFFVAEMEILRPAWVEIMQKSTLHADIEQAIQQVDSGYGLRMIKKWIEKAESGDITRLSEALSM